MADVEIREAGSKDMARLHALIQSAYRGDSARRGWTHEADLLEGQRIDAGTLQELIAGPQCQLLVAKLDDELIGCVQLADEGRGLCYLGLLTVAPSHQGSGLGKHLIEAAERLAIERYGAERIEMQVIKQRAELISFYERRGYRATGQERPFPSHDPRFGIPQREDLAFAVLEKRLPSNVKMPRYP